MYIPPQPSKQISFVVILGVGKETNSDEICAMKEQIYKLERQLATTDATTHHVHYHVDNRVVILIQNVEVDLAKIKEPMPLMWYNRHNKGSKYTQVFLPPQVPKKHPDGEVEVDLLEYESQTEPSITGILGVPGERVHRCVATISS